MVRSYPQAFRQALAILLNSVGATRGRTCGCGRVILRIGNKRICEDQAGSRRCCYFSGMSRIAGRLRPGEFENIGSS
jgi:hypothetical protein